MTGCARPANVHDAPFARPLLRDAPRKQHERTGFHGSDHGALLSLAGKPRRVSQYAIGNSLLALQMVEHLPEVALYAPLRLAVCEEDGGKTFVAYDCFSSLLSPYQRASGGAEAGG
jgi:Domain of unknown function DUF302